jgi:alkylation response protein AidB-like acyl-CoA dehydrogenase
MGRRGHGLSCRWCWPSRKSPPATAPFPPSSAVQNSLACGITLKYGSEAQQKARYLTKLASGEWLGCFCLTEPHTGSDAATLRTTARREGDEWVLNGVKQFITTGQEGQLAIVFAVTDKTPARKASPVFWCRPMRPATSWLGWRKRLGQHASDTAQILFENCRIPAENLLGQEGEGYKIALSNLEAGRIAIGAQVCRAWRGPRSRRRCGYAKEREAFGVRRSLQHQAVLFRLADMATQIEAARQLVWHAASSPPGRSPLSERSVDGQAVRLRDGGAGLFRRHPDSRRLRLLRRLSGGTSSIGMSASPKSTKALPTFNGW